MSCSATKFSITKGSDNTFTFTIKQDNSTLPLVIVGGDTFFATLSTLGPIGDNYPQVTLKALTVDGDGSAGRVNLVIPKADTENLITDIGDKVDKYYIRPTYKLLIECETVNNGNFIAKVQEVYVD